MTREEIIKDIVLDQLHSIIQLAISGNYLDLEEWLKDMLVEQINKDFPTDKALEEHHKAMGLQGWEEKDNG